jgi:hypothetical protein
MHVLQEQCRGRTSSIGKLAELLDHREWQLLQIEWVEVCKV